MTPRHEFLNALYAAFNARNLPEALSGLHEDVSWANGWEGGKIQGRNAVGEYWQRQWQTFSPRVEPQRFADQDGGTLVDVHQTVFDLRGQLISEQTVRHFFRCEGGLVKTFDIID